VVEWTKDGDRYVTERDGFRAQVMPYGTRWLARVDLNGGFCEGDAPTLAEAQVMADVMLREMIERRREFRSHLTEQAQ
jgi:hypothetical protein